MPRKKIPYKNYLLKYYDPNKEYLIPFAGSFAFMPKKNMITEEFIKKVYKALREKLGQHNYLVEAKSMWKWCIDCKKKAITISQPNDPVTRFADYRVLCLNCNTTQIIKSNNYSKKQELDSFISNLIVHFKLKII